jgi:hypothetical protein
MKFPVAVRVLIFEEDGFIVAHALDVDLAAQGKTVGQALADLGRAWDTMQIASDAHGVAFEVKDQCPESDIAAFERVMTLQKKGLGQ